MILQLKEGQSYEIGKNTGILLTEQIIKIPTIAFSEQECVISFYYFKDEKAYLDGKSPFESKNIRLNKSDLAIIKTNLDDIFVIENNLVFLNPDKVNQLLELITVDGDIMGKKYERKVS